MEEGGEVIEVVTGQQQETNNKVEEAGGVLEEWD